MPHHRQNASPVVQRVKESTFNAGDTGDPGSIPVLGRFPEGGNGNSLQYSCLKNPMNRGAWRATVQRVAELVVTEKPSMHTCTIH